MDKCAMGAASGLQLDLPLPPPHLAWGMCGAAGLQQPILHRGGLQRLQEGGGGGEEEMGHVSLAQQEE